MKTRTLKRDKENEGRFNRWILLLCGLLVCGISLIAHQKDFYGITTYKNTGFIENSSNLFTYYKLVSMGCLTVVLGIALGYRKLKHNLRVRLGYVAIACGMIIFGALTSILFNPLGYTQWIGFFTRTNGFFTYLVLYLFLLMISNIKTDEKTLEWIMLICAGFVILSTMIGLGQFYGYDIYNMRIVRSLMLPQGVDFNGISNTKIATAAFSLFTHYNYFSGFCAIFFPFMMSAAVDAKTRKIGAFYSVCALLLSVGVITSISQSGIFTLLLVALLVVFFLGRKETWKMLLLNFTIYVVVGFGIAVSSKVQTYRELAPIAKMWLGNPLHIFIVFGVVASVIVVTFLKNRLFKNNKKIISIFVVLFVVILISAQAYLVCSVAKDHKHLFTDRGYAWTNTYELLKKSPLIGYGPDNFYYAFPQDNPEGKDYSAGQAYDKPHNMLLQMYMDTGLIGLSGFLLLLLGTMLAIVRQEDFYEDGVKGTFLRGVLLVIMAYMIQGIVNDNHLTIQPLLFFILAVGMGITWEPKMLNTK